LIAIPNRNCWTHFVKQSACKELNPDKPEITNYKHHLILKLGQINYNIQISNKIKRQLFGILNFIHCDLPFDLVQGGGELVEPFVIYDL
jgi:hypothetical protein